LRFSTNIGAYLGNGTTQTHIGQVSTFRLRDIIIYLAIARHRMINENKVDD